MKRISVLLLLRILLHGRCAQGSHMPPLFLSAGQSAPDRSAKVLGPQAYAKSSWNTLSQLPLVSSYSAQISRQFHSFVEIHNGTPHRN